MIKTIWFKLKHGPYSGEIGYWKLGGEKVEDLLRLVSG